MCVCFQTCTHVRQRPPNGKKGRRKYVMSSAHPPKTAVVLKEAYKVRMFECVRVFVSVCVPVGRRKSLASGPVGAQLAIVSNGHLCSLCSSSPRSLLSLMIGDSRRSYKSSISIAPSVKMGQSWELHNIKLSETSCKGFFGCCVLSEVDTRASGHGVLVCGSLWLVLRTCCVLPVVEAGNPAAAWLCKSSHRGPLNQIVFWAKWTQKALFTKLACWEYNMKAWNCGLAFLL